MLFELIAAILAVGWMGTTWVLVAKINELEKAIFDYKKSQYEKEDKEYSEKIAELTKRNNQLINKEAE